MSLARSLLLRASRSQWLARQLRSRAFFRRAVRRFMPGEDLASALDAAAQLARSGIGTVLTQLGEQVTNRDEARAVAEHYGTVLKQIKQRSLPAHISVKLTHLGLEMDRAACERAVHTLAERARESGSFLWVDMEESRYVDATLDIYRKAKGDGLKLGVCLQAYLRRTPADLASLLPLGPAIRLVKGAYNEPAGVAFPNKRDVDNQYRTLAQKLLEETARGRASVVFGTHDVTLITEIRRQVQAKSYEFHLLYGIKSSEQRALAAEGCGVRVLISYGSAWFAWYMRRLAERPANVWFVVRNMF